MSFNKKSKNVRIIFLCIIYILTICFGNFSFATSSDTRTANISNGVYYFKNANNNLYVSDLDYFSMILGSFSGQTQQRWEISSASNGYYRIKNVYTGKYLTAPADYSEGSLIEQSTLLTSTQTQDRQLWAFTQVGSQYYIQAKSHQSRGIYLVCSSSIDVYGYALIQTSNPSGNREKWILEQVKTAYLIGIDGNEEGHDHTGALTNVNGLFMDLGYNSNLIITDCATVNTVKGYLQNCNFIAFRGHGNYDYSRGSYMCMDIDNGYSNRLYATNIYNNNYIIVDMSNCDVALFVGCYTAKHSTKSLPKAAVAAGADTAVGFKEEIYCDEAEDWTMRFGHYYSSGYSADYSADLAYSYVGIDTSISSMDIITN
jgi:hypothetical protein